MVIYLHSLNIKNILNSILNALDDSYCPNKRQIKHIYRLLNKFINQYDNELEKNKSIYQDLIRVDGCIDAIRNQPLLLSCF